MNIGIKSSYDDAILVSSGDTEAKLALGDFVIFSHGDHKEAIGKVEFLDRKKLDADEILLDGKVKRKANAKDLEKLAAQKQLAAESLEKAREKVAHLKLPMQIVDARIAFDETEVNFLFTSEERVDFKEIVPVLAGVMKKRIHLTQFGMRDRAKACCGFGICGRKQCCCSGVLPKFKSVTMDAVKKQELAMKGSDKLSGNCGKLLCCLNYELEEYERLRKSMPDWGSFVETPKGEGKVIALDILNQRVKVYLTKGGVDFFEARDVKTEKKK